MRNPTGENIRLQLTDLQKILQITQDNMRILIVMVEALRDKYGLTKEQVEEITDQFIEKNTPDEGKPE